MFQPGAHTEIETIKGYVSVQLEGLRESAYGLTDAQSRLTPCRSTLSIGGLLKHTTYVMAGHVPALRRQPDGKPTDEQWADMAQAFVDSFALREDETLEGALREFDATGNALLDHLGTVDPDTDVMTPPAPWDGRPEPTAVKARFDLVHLIEELARHAGHADIIREQIDGAVAGSLHLAAARLPGNPFIQPWEPSPSD